MSKDRLSQRPAPRIVRFGIYEADLDLRELRKRGVRLKLQQKPFQILELLLERPGELIGRKEIAGRLWPGVYVNFDRSLNTAVNALRRALGDSPRNPRFFETRPGLGYRFVAPVEPVEPSGAHPQSPRAAAHQDYLKGKFFCSRMTAGALHQGIAHLTMAVAADDMYALAYAALADAHAMLACLEAAPVQAALARATEFALTALSIDNGLAAAHAALARARLLRDWDWKGAAVDLSRALQLDPGCAEAHHGQALLLAAQGRSREALEEMRRACEIDPLSLAGNNALAWIFYIARHTESALRQAWNTLALEPHFAPAQHTLGLVHLQGGNFEDAIVEFQNACACSDDHPAARASLGHAYAAAGDRGSAAAILENLPPGSCWAALLHAALGDRQRALDCLESAAQRRDPPLLWLAVEPRLDALRREPRYVRLLEAVFRGRLVTL